MVGAEGLGDEARTQMEIENKLVNLSPGMAVTVEIKTGSRTVLNYLLSPLLRYKQESLRPRSGAVVKESLNGL
jgi:hypothetical protein